MATLNEQLTEIQNARNDMKTALENQGQTVSKDIRTYAEAISNIVSGESSSNMKIFNTVEEMNASTGNEDGDIAVIYGINPVKPNTTGFEANTLILPDKIPTDLGLTEDVDVITVKEDDMDDSFGFTFPAEYDESGIEMNIMSSYVAIGGTSFRVYVGTKNGAASKDYYERAYYQCGDDAGSIFFINGFVTNQYNLPFEILKLKVTDETSPLWNYIKFGNISAIEIYHYNGNDNVWRVAPSAMNTDATSLLINNTMLGGNGLITGTLDVTSKDKFTILPYRSIYDNDLHISDYILQKITPAEGTLSLGDKRYCMIFSSAEGGPDVYSFWVPDDSEVKYLTLSVSGSWWWYDDSSSSNNRKITKYKMGDESKLVKSTYLNRTKDVISASTLYDLTEDTPFYNIQTVMGICTNMEIRDEDGNILVPEGPSAAKTLKGSCYYNIFGEQVDGTYTGEEEIDASL